MKVSEVIALLPKYRNLLKFRRLLNLHLTIRGDHEISNDNIEEIETQIRACIEPRFEWMVGTDMCDLLKGNSRTVIQDDKIKSTISCE